MFQGSRCSKRGTKKATTYLVDLHFDPLRNALARARMCARMVVDSRKMASGGGE